MGAHLAPGWRLLYLAVMVMLLEWCADICMALRCTFIALSGPIPTPHLDCIMEEGAEIT